MHRVIFTQRFYASAYDNIAAEYNHYELSFRSPLGFSVGEPNVTWMSFEKWKVFPIHQITSTGFTQMSVIGNIPVHPTQI